LRYAVFSDQTTHALKAYDTFAKSLETEFGLTPSVHISKLAQDIRAGLSVIIAPATPVAVTQRSRVHAGQNQPVPIEFKRVQTSLDRASKLMNDMNTLLQEMRSYRSTMNAQAARLQDTLTRFNATAE